MVSGRLGKSLSAIATRENEGFTARGGSEVRSQIVYLTCENQGGLTTQLSQYGIEGLGIRVARLLKRTLGTPSFPGSRFFRTGRSKEFRCTGARRKIATPRKRR